MKTKIPQSLKNFYHLVVAFFSTVLFRFPARNLKIIGVTGTDGKTTTVSLIYHILSQSGYSAGMVSTIGAVLGSESYDTGFHVTTPSSFSIQKFLHKVSEHGFKYAVVEVTSHALDQNRVAFVPFTVGIITNVSQEHLDYHKSFKSYLLTKAKILNRVKYRILNSEDPSFEKLKMLGTGQLVTFGALGADYFGEEISSYEGITNYAIHYKTKQKQLKTLVVQTSLEGEFNLSNILAAFACCKVLGLEDKKIVASLAGFQGVEGRADEIRFGQEPRVIVDFAHTPAAIEAILKTFKKTTSGKLICVFGAAGERDKSKRLLMGHVAARFADYIIVTSEDPRNESAEKIATEIVRGILKAGGIHNKTFWKIIDRKEAIRKAVKNLAGKGDTVVILGKGHEKSMNIGGKEFPWSDREVAEQAVNERLENEKN